MEGKIQVNSGDVSIIAVNVDDKPSDVIPKKGEGYSFKDAVCTNDAIGSWNNANWEFRIQKLTQIKLHDKKNLNGSNFQNKHIFVLKLDVI